MRTIILLGAIVCVGAAACAETATPPKDPGAVTHAGVIEPTPNARPTCPLGMTGTEVAVANTPDGVDVSFTLKGDVSELRERVNSQAAVHGPGRNAGLGHGGIHNGAHTHGLRLSELDFPVHATATDIDGGGRVHVFANSPADVDKLQREVFERAAKIVALGDCPQ